MQRYFLHSADDIYVFSLPTVSKVIRYLFRFESQSGYAIVLYAITLTDKNSGTKEI